MSSGFVTESELEERKKVRQEEWERVRKPEDPETAPEEPVDSRYRQGQGKVKWWEGRGEYVFAKFPLQHLFVLHVMT